MSRCKPGELAVIVRCQAEDSKHHIGKIVRCVRLEQTAQGVLGWRTDPLLTTKAGARIGWDDSVLRPIRDPGDDAKDETLSWLPTPTQEVEKLRADLRQWAREEA
jgi:hypothetical protein